MSERRVHESDLSGQLIVDEANLARVDVLQHPGLEAPVRLDATPDELEQLGKLSIDAVIIEVTMPGEDQEPQRFVMTSANFGKLAVERSMADILAEATPIIEQPAKRQRGSKERDYNTLQWAGFPHRGTTSDEEARLVRENLPAINANLEKAEQRLIDPENPEHAARYGFDGSRDAAAPELPATTDSAAKS